MSGLPSATYSAPGVPLYAPAGGGGGSVGPNPAFSSITVATGAIYCPSTNISLISPGVNISSLGVSSINGAQYPPAQSDVFSTITVSSINGAQYPPSSTDTFSTITSQVANFSSINCLGSGNTVTVTGNVQTTAGDFLGNIAGSNATFSNVSVSTINGQPLRYPTQNDGFGFYFSTNTSNINANPMNIYIVQSTVYNVNDFLTYCGAVTAHCEWIGNGNTNNFTDHTGSNVATFGKTFIYDKGEGTPLPIVISGNQENGALTGSYGPYTQNGNQQFPIDQQEGNNNAYSMQVNNPPGGGGNKGQPYTGPGVEANITFYGPCTVTILDTIDFQLTSGDPTANYQFVYTSPVNYNNSGVGRASVTWR